MSAEATPQSTWSDSRVILVPYGGDPLTRLAQVIIAQHSGSLPNLSCVTILLPDYTSSRALRRKLLELAMNAGHAALLGPRISTVREWITGLTPLTAPVLKDPGRELMLAESLFSHPTLFGRSNPWTLARNLVTLFDELTRCQVLLPAALDEFTARLSRAYGVDARARSALSAEASLVHTLWRAWHQQHQQENTIDLEHAYIARLDASMQVIGADEYIYLVADPNMAPAELNWCRQMLSREQLSLLVHGACPAAIGADDLHPATAMIPLFEVLGLDRTTTATTEPYCSFLDLVFAPLRTGAEPATPGHEEESTGFADRARFYASQHKQSPVSARLKILLATTAEQEARAVDVQVRHWLLNGKQRIAIVCEDRRLARRVRALLDRAGIALHDTSGWALSTTSAAAALEQWLQCVEEDFSYLPLTSLLKSSFVFPQQDREELLATVYRLEHDIVQREQVARGIRHYRKHLDYRKRRYAGAEGSAVHLLLDQVEHAALPLLSYVSNANKHPPVVLLDALEESLQRLGMRACFENDPAGQRILQELRNMRSAMHQRSLNLDWLEFRSWLEYTLERYNFRLSTQDYRVQLLTLEHSALAQYDGMIIAGADRRHLPGSAGSSPFFNNAVRRELGLPESRWHYLRRFYHFRRLLEAAPQVLLTTRNDEDEAEVSPSPWLVAIRSFHALAYGDDLSDHTLAAWCQHPATEVIRCDTDTLPAPEARPAPVAARALLPTSISASAYQQLMDCPYQFYAARCLHLEAPEPIREAMQKSDYGERVHRILQAFHLGAKGVPGPYPKQLAAETRDEAIAYMQKISDAVFAEDLEDNFMHRGWLARWTVQIPRYIDWQIEHARNWRVLAAEVRADAVALSDDITLTGRLDRIDQGEHGVCIIDYKTGTIPRTEMVTSGEAVQLPFYALLAKAPVARVEYLSLDRNNFGTKAALEGDELNKLSHDVGARLRIIMDEINRQTPLPAWGDNETCRKCNFDGICRRQMWGE